MSATRTQVMEAKVPSPVSGKGLDVKPQVEVTDGEGTLTAPIDAPPAAPSGQSEQSLVDEASICARCCTRAPVVDGKTCPVCREASRRYSKRYWDKLPPEKRAERAQAARERQRRDPAKARAALRRYRDKKRREAFRRYGDACACCGEQTELFLQLHHLEGDGNEHRRAVGNGSAYWVPFSKDDAPENMQVLCANCHLAVTRVGTCPHQSTRSGCPVSSGPTATVVEEFPFLSKQASADAQPLEAGAEHAR